MNRIWIPGVMLLLLLLSFWGYPAQSFACAIAGGAMWWLVSTCIDLSDRVEQRLRSSMRQMLIIALCLSAIIFGSSVEIIGSIAGAAIGMSSGAHRFCVWMRGGIAS